MYRYRSEPCLCGPDVASHDKCPIRVCNCVNLSLVLERPSAFVWISLCFAAITASALIWACLRPEGTSFCVGRVVKQKKKKKKKKGAMGGSGASKGGERGKGEIEGEDREDDSVALDDDDEDFRDATAKPIATKSSRDFSSNAEDASEKVEGGGGEENSALRNSRSRATSVKRPPLHRGYAYAFAIIAGTSAALQQVRTQL